MDIVSCFPKPFSTREFGTQPVRLLLRAQVLDLIVLIVEDQPRERDHGPRVGDRIASKTAGMTREGAIDAGIGAIGDGL